MHDPNPYGPPPPPGHDPIAGVLGIVVFLVVWTGFAYLGVKGIWPDAPLAAAVPAGMIAVLTFGWIKNLRSGDTGPE